MWIVCQIGAREHYAIPRALDACDALGAVFTDFWVPPGSVFSRLPGGRRLRDRFHADLTGNEVLAPNAWMLAFELRQRLARRTGWPVMIERNRVFQQWAVRELEKVSDQGPRTKDQGSASYSRSTPLGTSGTDRRSVPTVFSYSYSARDLFRMAKARGWRRVLGQIDPGPEEERIVAEEQRRYPGFGSTWQPAPPEYWESWREELELADRIIVNSEWSRECLLKEGVAAEKMEVVPLVYAKKTEDLETEDRRLPTDVPKHRNSETPMFQLLFLGQVILRKGVGRLLDAMRLLRDQPVELILAGPSEIAESAWADLPNVRWIGPVPRSDCAAVYQSADALILPTLSDGYALTQLEALSYGLPVIASKHCGEAVSDGQNGWILEDLDPSTIAAAIRIAIRRPLNPGNIIPPAFSLNDLAQALLL